MAHEMNLNGTTVQHKEPTVTLGELKAERKARLEPLANVVHRTLNDREQKRDRAQMDNAALQRCSLEAAVEIVVLAWERQCDIEGRAMKAPEIAAIIYKHMRNGREL